MTLTKKDLQEIDRRLEDRFESFKDEIFEAFEKFRSEFFEKIDPILKEILASREGREIISHRVSDHEDRITVLEQNLKP